MALWLLCKQTNLELTKENELRVNSRRCVYVHGLDLWVMINLTWDEGLGMVRPFTIKDCLILIAGSSKNVWKQRMV